MIKAGVILSGCGVYDGTEVHESVLMLHALNALGVQVCCLAPSGSIMQLKDHFTTMPILGEQRTMIAESARIARGQIQLLEDMDFSALDCMLFPGGMGVVTNLCDFSDQGANCTVHTAVANAVHTMHSAGKPLGFSCIAGVLAAKLIPGVTVTIGHDAKIAALIAEMGAVHQEADATEYVVDATHQVVSTPAYMVTEDIVCMAQGMNDMVAQVVKLVSE